MKVIIDTEALTITVTEAVNLEEMFDEIKKILPGDLWKEYTFIHEVKPVEFHPYDSENADIQITKLKKIKQERNNDNVNSCLEKIRQDANNGLNIMPAVIEAVKVYASVGEITNAIKEVYGDYQEPIYF